MILLGIGHARVIWIQRHEIGERRNGLAGDALVVIGFSGLFIVGQGLFVLGVGGDFRLVAVAVGRPFVSFDGQRIILCFSRAAPIFICEGGPSSP